MKRHRKLLRLLFIIIALGSASSVIHAQAENSLDWQPGPVPDAHSAIKIALAFTGLDKCEGFSHDHIESPYRLLVEQDTLIPMLHDSIDGRSAWSVRFVDVAVKTKLQNSNVVSPHTRDFDVIIDDETGRLLKVTSHLRMSGREYSDDLWDSLPRFLLCAPDRGINLSPRPAPFGVAEAIAVKVIYMPPSPLEIEAYYIGLPASSDSLSPTPGSDSPQKIWFIVWKDVAAGSQQSATTLVPIVGYQCIDAETGQLSGEYGHTAHDHNRR